MMSKLIHSERYRVANTLRIDSCVGILLGRLLGFFRETLIASQFGVSGLADVAILTLTLPDLFMSVLLGGAASIVLVPVFVRLQGAG